MGIVEVLVAAGLLGVVTVGVSSLVVNMQTEQKRIAIRSTISDIKNRYSALITDNKSWTTTISQNAGMNCLANNNGCPDENPHAFDLYLPGSTVPFNRTTSTPYEGFSESGTPCSGFIPTNPGARFGTGNDLCPIGYSLVWQALQANVPNTMVKITARLVYNGTAQNKFQGSVETSYTSAGTFPLYDTTAAAPIARYDIQLTRNSTAVGRQFTVAHDGTSGTDPAGNCGTGVDTPRTLNFINDPSGLANLTGGGFTFQKAGLYKCSIMSIAFSVDSFTPRLMRNGAMFASGNGFAGRWSQVSANFDTSLTILDNEVAGAPSQASFGLTQNCQTLPSQGGVVSLNPPNTAARIDSFGLGMPTNPYTTNPRYASVGCTKMDD
ncbi:MAG: hypothetical protein H7061_08395 [Bdellovibrionaceae bacterium]|nr:hypothetical protein [Bdellovibrio sp.]